MVLNFDFLPFFFADGPDVFWISKLGPQQALFHLDKGEGGGGIYSTFLGERICFQILIATLFQMFQGLALESSNFAFFPYTTFHLSCVKRMRNMTAEVAPSAQGLNIETLKKKQNKSSRSSTKKLSNSKFLN